MKKLLLAAMGLLLMAGVASAGWNLRQKGDGGAYWLNDRDAREEHVLVTHLTVTPASPLSTAISTFVISPITGTIEKIYAVLHQALGQGPNETISFFVSSATSGTLSLAHNTVNEVTNGTAKMTLVNATPHVAGDSIEFTPNSATSNRVSKGGRIGIDNSGTTIHSAAKVTFTIVINPK